MTTEPDRPAESVDRKLLELLVTPKTRHPLRYDAARRELISDQDKLAFPIRDGIPIMRIDEARDTDKPPSPDAPTPDKT